MISSTIPSEGQCRDPGIVSPARYAMSARRISLETGRPRERACATTAARSACERLQLRGRAATTFSIGNVLLARPASVDLLTSMPESKRYLPHRSTFGGFERGQDCG
jgi:hypothetical protein